MSRTDVDTGAERTPTPADGPAVASPPAAQPRDRRDPLPDLPAQQRRHRARQRGRHLAGVGPGAHAIARLEFSGRRQIIIIIIIIIVFFTTEWLLAEGLTAGAEKGWRQRPGWTTPAS